MTLLRPFTEINTMLLFMLLQKSDASEVDSRPRAGSLSGQNDEATTEVMKSIQMPQKISF